MVVGIDFSPACEIALETACGIARTVGRADIHAVHAASIPPALSFDSFEVAPVLDVGADRARLDALCAIAGAGHRIVRHVVVSATERAIVAIAREQHADIIIVGTHDTKSGIGRLLTGSVVERIVRAAPCSVLVTRPRATDDDGDADSSANAPR